MPSKRSIDALEPSDESAEATIQCDPISPPIHFDADAQRTFYTACKTEDLTFAICDCVRVKLGDDGEDVEACAYAQVLAIYEEQEEVFAEVRWFQQYRDLPKKVQKRLGKHNI